MKRLGILLLCAFMLTSCAVKDKKYLALPASNEPVLTPSLQPCSYADAYAQLSPDLIREQDLFLEFVPGALEHETLQHSSTDIVIATICSIDGGSTYNEVKQTTVLPYTYGTMRILRSLKGDLSAGQTVAYTRIGGIVSYEDYLETLHPNQREAAEAAVDKPAYIRQQVYEDIPIEVGKTYLVYLWDDSSVQVRSDAVVIHGYQGGLREIRTVNKAAVADETPLSEIEAYQFADDSWEPLNLLFDDAF